MTDRFERDLERMLAADGERVSAATRQELARRRRAVLDAVEASPGFGGRVRELLASGRSWWLPAGAMAAAVLAVVLIRPGAAPVPAMAATEEAIDMDILLADENLELYDDLDFFEWLAAVDDEAG